MTTNTVKHTPGPWEWTHDAEPYSDQWTLSPGVMMVDGSDGTPGGDEIDRANARLITAAPDMLEALRLVDAYLYVAAPESNERQIVTAAISKAEGR